MGRQKRYQKVLLVRLTNDEYRQLIERANRSAVSLSRLLVESTLANKSFTNELKERRDQTERLIDQRDWAINQVVRVGNNLNQIARQLNSQTGTISARRIERVLGATFEALASLHQLVEHGGTDPTE